jgi:methylmalonyl-CoA mutase N-terminal domain/subunit
VGGSEYVERLTDELEAEAMRLIRQIDDLGGAVTAIEQGFIQGEIQNAAYEYQRQIESGARIIVGVNRYQAERENPIELFKLDPALERGQIEGLREVKASRSMGEVKARLQDLEAAARSGANLMPPILACVDCFTTLGEISDCLRGVFGESAGGHA